MTSSDAPSRFLTAEWRDLAMLNFAVEPALLRSLVPAGTELDEWQGVTFVSLVAFLFLDTRVLGLAIPFHRNFPEANLRFYVRHKAADGWRRGVVFIKEIVPRRAIAWAARALYGENYVALPMGHRIEADGPVRRVAYWWRSAGGENRVELEVRGEPAAAAAGSQQEFITEHYWGYARRGAGATTEYRVEHPRWRVWDAAAVRFECDVAGLYGAQFAEPLRQPPASAFLADGSAVTVYRGRRL